jgi:ribosomal protein S18 acetylase RimI-like enzyme
VLNVRPLPESDLPAARERLLQRAAARRVRTSFQDAEAAHASASQDLERGADKLRFYEVVDDNAVSGWLAWWCGNDESVVNDLVLDDPERSAELRAPLVDLARADGSRFLGISAMPDEPAREALAAAEGMVRRATNMVLPLDGVIADPGGLVLREMTQPEFDAYIGASTEQYIGELAAAGMTPEAARKQGEEQMAELVPDGLASPGQTFFTAWVGETAVGVFWVSTEHPMAYVYDIAVDESQRRRGYGEAIMNAGARWARDLGHPALGLNVFGHNPHARALYDKLGYRVTQDFRSIDLADAG